MSPPLKDVFGELLHSKSYWMEGRGEGRGGEGRGGEGRGGVVLCGYHKYVICECCILHTCTNMHVHVYVPTCMYVHVPTCTNMHVHVPTCTNMHVHVPTCTNMDVHVPTCTNMHVHVPTCMYMYQHACTCTAESLVYQFFSVAAAARNLGGDVRDRRASQSRRDSQHSRYGTHSVGSTEGTYYPSLNVCDLLIGNLVFECETMKL